MEDEYREIKIGVFGGKASNKINWLKHLYKFFMLNDYNDRELSEKVIFKPHFNLRLPYYNNVIIVFPIKEHVIDINVDVKKRSEESIEEDLHFHYDSYIMNLHYAVIIEDEKNAVYKTYMNKLFYTFYIHVPKEIQPLEANELLEKSFSPALAQINGINKHYVDFTAFSKEKHYNTFFKYARKFTEYNKMNQNDLEGMFNYSEQFSFDEHDYNDESIMLLQVFSANKTVFEKKKFSPFKTQCDCYDGKECTNNQRIIPYDAKLKMFICESCAERKKGRKRCFVCRNYLIEAETIRPSCCRQNRSYCIFCISKCINDWSHVMNKRCICGGELDSDIVQVIKYYQLNIAKHN